MYTKKNAGNFRYLLWSFVSLCVIEDYLLSFLDLFYHIECWTKPHLDSTYKPLYTGALGTWIIIAVIDFLLAIIVVLLAKKKDFPAPDLVRYITCHFTICPNCVVKDMKNTNVIQVLAVWHILAALQTASFHACCIYYICWIHSSTTTHSSHDYILHCNRVLPDNHLYAFIRFVSCWTLSSSQKDEVKGIL